MKQFEEFDEETRKQIVNKKIYSYIGLAMKAGFLVGGDFMVEKMVKTRKAKLVLIAEDTSMNTRKKYENMCEYHKTCLYLFGTKESIGNAAGKEYRAILAICDKGMAEAVKKQFASIDAAALKAF